MGAGDGPSVGLKSELVYAAGTWPTNADLVVDLVRLGYILDTDSVLDPTFGRGKWWTKFRPVNLTTHDRYTLDGVDFRALPHDADSFDVVAFDPPYVCPGGIRSSTTKDLHDRFGMASGAKEKEADRDFRTPAELQDLIDAGLAECFRVVRPRGLVLVKCMDYVTSGKLWIGTHRTLCAALALGFECVDRFEHVGGTGPQSQTRQVHARRNLSTLFVLKKPRRPRVRADRELAFDEGS